MRIANRSIYAHVSLCTAVAVLAGCAVSKVTEDAVASADTAVMQAQQTIGNSESGAVELQRAREHVAEAKRAVDEREEEAANRHAQQATLDARLATAKAQSAVALRAVDEMRASIQTLREESQRSMQTTR